MRKTMKHRNAQNGERDHNGAPACACNDLGKEFLRAFAADFARYGKAVIEMARKDRPHDYLKLVIALLPKQISIQGSAPGSLTGDMSDEEFFSVLNAVRAAIAAKEAEEAEKEGEKRAAAQGGTV
jgi:hypothetical protein